MTTTMEKIITDRNEAHAAGLLTSGIFFVRADDGLKMYLPIRYDSRVDLHALTYCDPAADSPLPTLNDLLAAGSVVEKKAFREYDVYPEGFDNCEVLKPLTGEIVRNIIADFKAHGFNVTRKAVMHNYKAWYHDLKSGWRDTARGYHLFTPCGCNPLSFSATTLFGESDWQETYEW